jgi:transcriptional regulator with XRE-family HTH domain
LGLTTGAIGKYERGERRPEAEVLARLRETLGVDINWLLTGQGAMFGAVATNSSGRLLGAIDEDLNAHIVAGIFGLYRDLNLSLAPMDLGRLAARMYGDLATAYDDPGERRIAIRGMLAQLRRQLLDPAPSSVAAPTKVTTT